MTVSDATYVVNSVHDCMQHGHCSRNCQGKGSLVVPIFENESRPLCNSYIDQSLSYQMSVK